MNEITNFQNAGLPTDPSKLAETLQNFAASQPQAGGGDPFLRMVDGEWVYGQENIEVEDESEWAVNHLSIAHGHICWGDGEVLGEVMVPCNQPAPAVSELEDHGQYRWSPQLAVQMMCVEGKDAGTQVMYKINSVGGRNAVTKLIGDIATHLSEDPATPVAIIQLKSDSYKHKKYGKTYVPIFEILEFTELSDEPPQADEEEPAKPVKKKATKKEPAPEVNEDEADDAEESNVTSMKRRRRRSSK